MAGNFTCYSMTKYNRIYWALTKLHSIFSDIPRKIDMPMAVTAVVTMPDESDSVIA